MSRLTVRERPPMPLRESPLNFPTFHATQGCGGTHYRCSNDANACFACHAARAARIADTERTCAVFGRCSALATSARWLAVLAVSFSACNSCLARATLPGLLSLTA